MHFLFRLAFFVLLTLPIHAHAETVTVHDGDTLRIENLKIRLWGIDAPELNQLCLKDKKHIPCGKTAKLALETLVGTKGDIECKIIDIDRYKRSVARCTVGGADIGSMMVRLGQAVDYTKYSAGFYEEQEKEARKEKRGVWATEFKLPWVWRSERGHKK